ncbi:MAG: nicotinate-nucleotide adenylyltransferase [Anaerolineales bacterium]
MNQDPIRYGILGGSFNPPHYGHLALAETARVQLQLTRVLFVPAGQPPHKSDHELTTSEDRVAMVRAAIADNEHFILSCVDVDRPGPHYTVDMITRLHAAYAHVTGWVFLMGEDSLHDLPDWRDPEGILAHVDLAVMPRISKRVDMEELAAQLPALEEHLTWLDIPPVNYAATDLRRRVKKGLPLRYFVPPAVEEIIKQRELYKT